jgi:hypothetical protein
MVWRLEKVLHQAWKTILEISPRQRIARRNDNLSPAKKETGSGERFPNRHRRREDPCRPSWVVIAPILHLVSFYEDDILPVV